MNRVLCALAALSLGVFLVPAAQAAAPASVRFQDSGGLHVLSVTSYDVRDYNVSVLTSALGRPVNVRILLPTDYTPSRRYPVLHLFHGTSGAASDWIEKG